jgi:hypothetical protein
VEGDEEVHLFDSDNPKTTLKVEVKNAGKDLAPHYGHMLGFYQRLPRI